MIEELATQVPPHAPLIGNTVAVVVGALGLFAMLALPVLRAPATLWAAARWLARAATGRLRPHLFGLDPLRLDPLRPDPLRPPNVDGLTASLARLTRQTRTLALELRRCADEADEWPADTDSSDAPRAGWRESLFGDLGGRMSMTEMRGEVFEWLRVADTLPGHEREALTAIGIDVEAVRRTLTADTTRTAAAVVRALAGLLWSFDERLAAASTAGYRSTCAEQPVVVPILAPIGSPEDDDRQKRRRWSGTLAEHGRGIARMAAGYTRTPAEREDLEQDIALALWRALPTFRGESSLKTFAYKVARYCCFRHVRRRADVDASTDPQTLPDPAASLESALLHADQRARIEQALGELPDTLESVLTMHLTGLSCAQIAASLGITERNVTVRLSRARARLRRQLVAA